MKIIKIIFLLILSVNVKAEKIQYFDSRINFWGDGEKPALEKKEQVTKSEDGNGKFHWKTYLDPKNKEFFKEGDYTPPEPFMEIARNPSDENIKQWFEFMKKKNELAKNLDQRMQEYLAKNSSMPNLVPLAVKPDQSIIAEKPKSSDSKIEPERFRLRMYFESTCPHCKRMFEVLKRLQGEGFHIEALQVDNGPVPEVEKIVSIGKADPAELKKHGIKGVPYLLIADTKRKALLPAIEGYHDYGEIIQLLKAAN